MSLKVRMGMCVNAVSEKIRDSMATVQCELELPKKNFDFFSTTGPLRVCQNDNNCY